MMLLIIDFNYKKGKLLKKYVKNMKKNKGKMKIDKIHFYTKLILFSLSETAWQLFV